MMQMIISPPGRQYTPEKDWMSRLIDKMPITPRYWINGEWVKGPTPRFAGCCLGGDIFERTPK